LRALSFHIANSVGEAIDAAWQEFLTKHKPKVIGRRKGKVTGIAFSTEQSKQWEAIKQEIKRLEGNGEQFDIFEDH
jgi:hypothetical protein